MDRGIGFGLAVALMLASGQAPAQGQSCQRAHERAQVLKNASEPLAARAQLVRCAARSCPGPLRQDCAEWLRDVERQIPSLVPVAQSTQGQELGSVRVLVDGELALERIDGRAIEMEPGKHRFRFESAGFESTELTVIARLGEKQRQLHVVLQPHEPPGPPAPFWILSGVSVAALASFATFSILGTSRYEELKSECAPRCNPSTSAEVRERFLIADISLGVAVLAAGGAAYFYFQKRETEQDVHVRPVFFGSGAGLVGTF